MRSTVFGLYKNASEYLLPPLAKSQFKEKGVLTPDEFVRAGDYLVNSCPTWAWEAGDASKARNYLPPNKQYLITRNVPCMRRASEVVDYDSYLPTEEPGQEADAERDGWIETNSDAAAAAAGGVNADGFEELPSVSRPHAKVIHVCGDEEEEEEARAREATGGAAEQDIPDISDLDINAPVDDDGSGVAALARPPAASADPASGVLHTRTYDLLISYDKHYAVPRFWLVGYNEHRAPLTQAEVLEDVINDYTQPAHSDRKTVTVEDHPHRAGGGRVVSVHPCRHARAMHSLGATLAGEGGEWSVEHYMVLFLKLISSVVPTIEYDYTMNAGGA